MKIYCDKCEKMVEPIVDIEKKKLQVKDIEVVVDLKISRCNCGEEVFNRTLEIENDIIIFDAYKKETGLLTSKEIISIRNKYGLSQSTYAKILGLGEKTITRYENGTIQEKAYDNLMRLSKRDNNLYELFQMNKTKLSKSEILRITAYYEEKTHFRPTIMQFIKDDETSNYKFENHETYNTEITKEVFNYGRIIH